MEVEIKHFGGEWKVQIEFDEENLNEDENYLIGKMSGCGGFVEHVVDVQWLSKLFVKVAKKELPL